MSFTADVKLQLTELDKKNRHEKLAEFYGIYLMSGGTVTTGIFEVAERARKLCRRSGGRVERVWYRAGKKTSYNVSVRWSGDFVLSRTEEGEAFLRGCFLLGGYVSDPDSQAHLEISFKDETAYELGIAAFQLCGIAPKGTIRGQRFILYLKDSEQVADTLAHLGAIRAVLEYENAVITRQGRREGNRVANCDDANINKALAAGEAQVNLIRKAMELPGYGRLPEGVKEIARLRLENPELSLTELGEMCVPPVSKAGAAHRFGKLKELLDGRLS